jgi:hypothetical protein
VDDPVPWTVKALGAAARPVVGSALPR